MIFSIAQIRGSRSTNITESSNLYYYLFSPTVISDNIFLTASNLDSVLDRSKWNNNFYYRRTNPAPIISIEKKEKRKEKKFNFEKIHRFLNREDSSKFPSPLYFVPKSSQFARQVFLRFSEANKRGRDRGRRRGDSWRILSAH